MATEGKDDIEQTHCIIPKVYVFQIPKLQTSSGYKASDWPKTPIWSGQLRIVSKGDKCSILLEHTDKDGLFAACPVNSDKTVEPTTDSSRYFVLRMTDGSRHAVIGIGFNDRTQAFDFKVSLQDWKNSNKEETGLISSTPLADLSIPQGGRIHVNLSGAAAKKKGTDRDRAASGSGASSSLADAVSSLKLAEPTKNKEKKKKKSVIATTQAVAQSGTANLFDFSGGATTGSDPFANDPFSSTSSSSSSDPFASASSSSSKSTSKPAKQADPSDWVSF